MQQLDPTPTPEYRVTGQEAADLLDKVLASIADELGCPCDNEEILMAIHEMKERRDAETTAYERGRAAGQVEERKACADLCIELRHPRGCSSETDDWIAGTDHCADAIRARGNTEGRDG